ncbi:MAG: hypothetical protein ACP5UD_07550 [Conexivisphaera sp.]
MTYQEEFEKAKKRLQELLRQDDAVLAERAEALHDTMELMDFMDVLRYHETYHYPCCHAAYLFLRGELPHLTDLALREAGLDVEMVRRAGGWPAP